MILHQLQSPNVLLWETFVGPGLTRNDHWKIGRNKVAAVAAALVVIVHCQLSIDQGVARVAKATPNPLYEKNSKAKIVYSIYNIHTAH